MQNLCQIITSQKQNSPFVTQLQLCDIITVNKLAQEPKNCFVLHWFCMKMHEKVNVKV